MDEPLEPICKAWLRQIDQAKEHKEKNFQKVADLFMKFLTGPYNFIYEPDFLGGKESAMSYDKKADADNVLPMPSFRMSLNRVAEFVDIFGPFLYHKNPQRQVNERKPANIPALMLQMMLPPMQMPGQMPGMGGGMGMGPPPMPGGPMDPMSMAMAGPGMMPPQDPMQMLMASMSGDPMMQGPLPGMPTSDPIAGMLAENNRIMEDMVRQTRIALLDSVLNYTPNELGLKEHSRLFITEGMVKGKGVLWPEIITTPGGQRMVGSFFDSIDNLLVDPDVEMEIDAKWVARRCIHPIWEVEKIYGLPKGSIQGSLESVASQETRPDSDKGLRDRKGTNDLLEYWKIYSRMGCGARLAGTKDNVADLLEQMGDNVFLVVAKNVPYPLNIPMTKRMDDEQFTQAMKWPIPFHDDPTSPWPFAPVSFREIPRKVWPQSYLAPAMAELLFLNWAYSYLATKVATTSRDLLAVAKALERETREALQSGKNLAVIEMAQGQGFDSIDKMIQFIQHPPMNKDIWDVIKAVEANFERRTGMNELLYGETTRGMRSAEEAALKGDQIKVRPEDMANRVEEAMTLLARKEAIAWHMLNGQDVRPIVGNDGAALWDMVIGPLTPEKALEFDYRIEANSVRRPNRERDVQNMAQVIQTILQPYFQHAMTSGKMGPVNAIIRDWMLAMDKDPTDYMLEDAPMPPPMLPGSEPASASPPPAA